MSLGQSMLGEFDHEMANSRRTLERIPLNKLEWKPDPRSMPLGQLAGHVVEMLGWGSMVLTAPSMDMNPGDHKPYIPQRGRAAERIRQERGFAALYSGLGQG